MTAFREVLGGFMDERGIGNPDELAAAMRDESGQPYDGEEVRAILEDPAGADAEFFYMLEVGLGLDGGQVATMMRALGSDIRARRRRAAS